MYTDGASRGNPGPSGAGAVVYRTGHEPDKVCAYVGDLETNNVAEYRGAILGLQRVKEVHGTDVHVQLFADSDLVIKQLGGQWQVKHPGLKPHHKTALALLNEFSACTLAHVPRAENTEADAMANEAIDSRSSEAAEDEDDAETSEPEDESDEETPAPAKKPALVKKPVLAKKTAGPVANGQKKGGPRSWTLSTSEWKGSRQERRVEVSEWKGKTYVAVREFYQGEGGKMLPGNKGISLTLAQWRELSAVVGEVDEAVEGLE